MGNMGRKTVSRSRCPFYTEVPHPARCTRSGTLRIGNSACSSSSTRRAVRSGSTASGLIATEVNGFVSWIASFAFSLGFFVWAIVPHEHLQQLSISYLLNTYWALAVPVIVLISVGATFLMYIALNLLNTRPLDSFCLVSDELAPPPCPNRLKELRTAAALASAAAKPSTDAWQQWWRLPQEGAVFSQVQDLPLPLVNKIMFRLPALADDGRVPRDVLNSSNTIKK